MVRDPVPTAGLTSKLLLPMKLDVNEVVVHAMVANRTRPKKASSIMVDIMLSR